jgi:hypothetical protein
MFAAAEVLLCVMAKKNAKQTLLTAGDCLLHSVVCYYFFDYLWAATAPNANAFKRAVVRGGSWHAPLHQLLVSLSVMLASPAANSSRVSQAGTTSCLSKHVA